MVHLASLRILIDVCLRGSCVPRLIIFTVGLRSNWRHLVRVILPLLGAAVAANVLHVCVHLGPHLRVKHFGSLFLERCQLVSRKVSKARGPLILVVHPRLSIYRAIAAQDLPPLVLCCRLRLPNMVLNFLRSLHISSHLLSFHLLFDLSLSLLLLYFHRHAFNFTSVAVVVLLLGGLGDTLFLVSSKLILVLINSSLLSQSCIIPG